MSENQTPEQIPEPGWPEWANTPEKRERNQQDQARRNERIQQDRAAISGTCAGCGEHIELRAGSWTATSADARRMHRTTYCPATETTWHQPS